MKDIRKFLCTLLMPLLAAGGCRAGDGDLKNFPAGFTPREVGTRVAERFLPSDHMLYMGKWIHYPEVCTWFGALRFARAAEDTNLIERLKERFDPLFHTDSHMLPPRNHVDMNMFGCLPMEFYKATGRKRYFDLGIPYADSQWTLPDGASQTEKIWHDLGYTWQTRLWIDDMYMITIVQSQAWLLTGDRKYIDRTAREMVMYLDSLQRPNGLFYHAPDVPFFWGRGNGWMAAGMTELLGVLPADSPYRDRIMEGYLTMMASLGDYRNGEGLWNQLVDDPESWTETSCSGMFAYSMITGVKNGWLDAGRYAPMARQAWMSLVPYINGDGDMTRICIGTNKLNDRQYYIDRPRMTGDFHGQAPMLWCAWALMN